MIEVWYCDIAEFTETDLFGLLAPFSQIEKDQVLRFHFPKDRLFRLIGRLMVCYRLQCKPEAIEKTSPGKPYVAGKSTFNISHAGNVVAVVFSDHEIGLDIEIIGDLSTNNGILSYFHPDEQAAFNRVDEETKQSFFYHIWTRKEAFLKAVGVGILEGINTHNCLSDEIERSGENWFIRSVDELDNYACAICQKNKPITTIQFRKLDKTTLIQQHETLFL